MFFLQVVLKSLPKKMSKGGVKPITLVVSKMNGSACRSIFSQVLHDGNNDVNICVSSQVMCVGFCV